MKIGRERGFTVKLGDYEMYRFGAYCEISSEELEVTSLPLKEQLVALEEFTTEYLNEMLHQELSDASEMSSAQKTILHDIIDATGSPVSQAPDTVTTPLAASPTPTQTTTASKPKRILRRK